MPLLDHFNPPISKFVPWRTFHGTWAVKMAELLNERVLPPGYRAMPFVNRENPFEIDVATLEVLPAENGSDAVSWQPESPPVALAIRPSVIETARVDVMTDDGDPRLAAAIELVSPGNKDRASARESFAAKCAECLRSGAGVVVVDAVTNRRGDLHAAILAALEASEDDLGVTGPSAISYRAVLANGEAELQAWPKPLIVGKPLPTVPLWLAVDLAVPLDLEMSHAATCEVLLLRPAG